MELYTVVSVLMAPNSLDDLVGTALALAQERQRDVADIPLMSIAAASGISRSTLLRRLGGTRRTLDDAVRAAGLDPGGRKPVRERAIAAAARLMSERGVAGVTLDAVAATAGCSLPSLHTVFEGRDGLLAAVFDSCCQLQDLERVLADPPADTGTAVDQIIAALLHGFNGGPGMFRAVLADWSGRPDGPAQRVLAPQVAATLGRVSEWLSSQQRGGRLRDLAVPVLMELLIGPVVVHLLLAAATGSEPAEIRADEGAACHAFASAFLRTAATEGAG